MTQFLSFQASTTPLGIASPAAIASNGASALGGNTTSSTAVDALANGPSSFANLLNTQTGETGETISFQDGLVALANENASLQSVEGGVEGAVEGLLTTASNFETLGDVNLVESDEPVVLSNAVPENTILLNSVQNISQNEDDALLSIDGSQVDGELAEGVADFVTLNNPAFVQVDVSNEVAVTAILGVAPITASPDGDGDIELNGESLDGFLTDDGLPQDSNEGLENLFGLSRIDASSDPLPFDAIISGAASTQATLSNNNVNQDGSISLNSDAGPNGNVNLDRPQALGGLATISQSLPEPLTSVLPVGTSENAGLNSAVGNTITNGQIAIQLASGRGLEAITPVQATNENTALLANSIVTNVSADPSSVNLVSANEQPLGQLNVDQAEGAPQRADQNSLRQAGAALNVLGTSEGPANPLNLSVSQGVPQGATQSTTQGITLTANSSVGAAISANGENAQNGSNGAGSQNNQNSENGLNSQSSQSNQSALSNLSQVAQLLGQTGSSEAQALAPQVITQSTQQLATNTPLTNYTPQASAQSAPAFFTAETLPALSAQLSRGIVGGRDSFNIQLNPSELGRVDVRFFTNDDGSVNARVLVERVDTLDLFQRDLRALERSLLQSGIKLSQEGIDLSLKDNGANDGGNNAATNGEFTGNEDQRGSEETQRLEDEGNRALNDRLLVEDIEANLPSDVIQTIYARFTPGQLNIEV